MPFSKTTDKHDEEYWTEFFYTIEKIMGENGYTCIRSEVGPYKLFTNIVHNIEKSDMVVSVLTDFNANVWYELGIRHTLKVGTIMLLQEGQKAPFDISDYGIIFYKDNIGLERQLRENIGNYLDKFDGNNLDSPVICALNGSVNTSTKDSIEKKLEDMQQLIWKLVEEMPRNKEVERNTRKKQNRILWVDDYPINNEAVINLFSAIDIQFDIAISTKQGIEMYKQGVYDMIITDMGRGDESDAGLSLIKGLKSLGCQIPIIVYASCRAIAMYGEDAIQLGAYAVINGIGNIISLIYDILDV